MRKIIVLFVVLLLSISAFAQLEVKEGSFKEVPGFVNINIDKMYDDNDKPYAVLKIKTENINSKERRELNFGGDAQTFFEAEYREGEVWLYISYYATFIKISHEELSSTEFYFPFDMKPKCGYELTLVSKAAPVKEGWGSLSINTKPENGAKVLLNGRSLPQNTPYKNDMIPSGKYEITVSKERFVTTTKTIEINDGENKSIEIEMPYIYGDLNILSEPSDATVLIDGVDYGTTPLNLNKRLVAGSHELKLEKKGCATLTKQFILDGVNTLVFNEKLETGREMSIITGCDGDKIFVDGKYVGESPLNLSLNYEKHEIYAIKAYGNDSVNLNNISGVKTVSRIISADVNDTCLIQLSVDAEKPTFIVNGVSFDMVAVHGGTFIMGCSAEQGNDCYSRELPTHNVTLSDYYIGKLEATQQLWDAVMGNDLSKYLNDTIEHPAMYISWNDCQDFIVRLNDLTDLTFRLPTEAEWEYAARGGEKSKGYKYSGSNNIDDVAIYDLFIKNKGEKHFLGAKKPNELGIYDMSGSMHEYCQDWYGEYSGESQVNPTGPSTGNKRVWRDGSWFGDPFACRVSFRGACDPDEKTPGTTNGFRLALNPPEEEFGQCLHKINNSIGVDNNLEIDDTISEEDIFLSVEESPEFPGGGKKLKKYIKKNLNYPETARRNNIHGKVIVSFIVEIDGSLSNVNVLRGIGGGCDEEAIRIVETMPKWRPGKQRGKPVRVEYKLVVDF